MKKVTAILIALLLLFLLTRDVQGCWVYLSVEDLFNESEAIVIAKIIEQDHDLVDKADDYTDYWLIELDYVLRGDFEQRSLIITTPGEGISTQFGLGEPGDQILVFMNQYDTYFTPYSPQGVVSVSVEDFDGEVTSGAQLKDLLNIDQGYNDDTYESDIKGHIDEIDMVVDMRAMEAVQLTKESRSPIVMGVGGVALLGIFLVVFGKKKLEQAIGYSR